MVSAKRESVHFLKDVHQKYLKGFFHAKKVIFSEDNREEKK